MNKHEQIDYILSTFDFCKVHLVMLTLDWNWSTEDGQSLRVPSVAELKSRVRVLLQTAQEGMITSCGGFVVKNVNDFLSLEFCVEQCDCYDAEAVKEGFRFVT